MIHVVFQEADIAVLEKAIELDAKMAGLVLQIRDDFAVGPLGKVYEAEGFQERKAWWEEVLEYSPYLADFNMTDDRWTVHQLAKYLKEGIYTFQAAEGEEPKVYREEEEAVIWVWMGQNQHDVCGYYWLMSQLKDFQGRVQVLYMNNLPFINEKGGIFYPVNLFEIQPKEFLKAKRLARPITLSEFEVDPDEWKKLCNESAGVRILEGGKKIVSKEVTFYDKDILTAVGSEAGKLNKVISNTLSKMKLKTGDAFLVWRIRQLVAEGKLDVTGDWAKGWKDIVVKPAGMATSSEEQPAEEPAQ
ncbi:protein of unknown function [Filimonas lacunae]|uniref:DUF1835 domain-containing protein n=1 Tax=Filimonas lacunae TaxID=477680 RepID=A0A173MBA0_9BACT|nr:DUF1835 domain-containing protein [Filimonas lacunae]BAV04807.1 hypothetical protein FLA_0806 [Filimonas lacunae]SIT34739.1 protein of unknown function [Filimonas lacunae]